MADHVRAFGQHPPDERGRLLRPEVHLVATSLHHVKQALLAKFSWRSSSATCPFGSGAGLPVTVSSGLLKREICTLADCEERCRRQTTSVWSPAASRMGVTHSMCCQSDHR
jgi:hypothetical protein